MSILTVNSVCQSIQKTSWASYFKAVVSSKWSYKKKVSPKMLSTGNSQKCPWMVMLCKCRFVIFCRCRFVMPTNGHFSNVDLSFYVSYELSKMFAQAELSSSKEIKGPSRRFLGDRVKLQ